jgi:hypothetical protein
MKNVTVVNEQVVRYATAKAALKGESFDVVVNRLLEKAMKDEQYRANRNAQKWQETKALKETVAALEAELIHRNTLMQIGAGNEDMIEEKE